MLKCFQKRPFTEVWVCEPTNHLNYGKYDSDQMWFWRWYTGAWSMGSRLGSLDGWNGDHPIHILSAGNAFLKIT
jgi:hypothetical protein